MDNIAYRITIYKDILCTSLNIIENDINDLTKKIADIQAAIAGMGTSVPDKFIIELEAKKKNLEKLEKDKEIVDNYLTVVEGKINTFLAKTVDEQKEEIHNTEKEIETILKTFFTEYKFALGDDAPKVDLIHGESQFKRMLKNTSKYGKLQKKIDKLQAKINKKMAKLALKGVATLGGDGKPKLSAYYQMKQERIDAFRSDQAELKESRQLILTKRQADIYKRNRDLSKHEAEDQFFTDRETQANIAKATAVAAGDTQEEKKQEKIIKESKTRAEDARKKIGLLKKTQIVVQKSRHVLLDQEFFSIFRSKFIKETGELDNRSWEEYRAVKIDAKTGKKL